MISDDLKNGPRYGFLEATQSGIRREFNLPEFPHLGESVAILIDYENVSGAGFGSVWSIVEDIAETEHVGIVRAYANWHKLSKARSEFEAKGVLPTTNNSGKNSADIQLATDALSIAYEKPAIYKIVIVSGDRDFTPVVRRIRSLGRCVWGYGTVGVSSELLKKVCDNFFVLKGASGNSTGQLAKNKGETNYFPIKVKPLPRSFLEKAAWAMQLCCEAHALNANQSVINANLTERLSAVPFNSIKADHLFQSLRQLDTGFQLCDWVTAKKRRRFHLLSALQSKALVHFNLCPQIKNYCVSPGSELVSFLNSASRPSDFSQLVEKQALKLTLGKCPGVVPCNIS